MKKHDERIGLAIEITRLKIQLVHKGTAPKLGRALIVREKLKGPIF